MTVRTLAVRLDSDGDVLLTGPAVRALASGSATVHLLCSPAGERAARLLPGVADVLVFDPPWGGLAPSPVDGSAIADLVARLHDARYDHAVIFTSFHQSALPMALVAKLAGVPRVSATSEDAAGSLLDVRHRRVRGAAGLPGTDLGGAEGGHEVEAALALAAAAGFPLPPGDDGRLAIRPLGEADRGEVPLAPYVVLHPVASVAARSISDSQCRAIGQRLLDDGWTVVVTGGPTPPRAGEYAVPDGAVDMVGRTTYAELAGLLAGAACVVAVNTGPAHLAAAVGTPVVSLFAPVVSPARWAPWGVPTRVLGDLTAPCRATRARECPYAGHPCLSSVAADEVARAVHELAALRESA